MHNILVTGSNGQLGSEIRELSKDYSYNFFFTTRDELDISNEEQIKNFIEINNINTIINCAAYTAVDIAETDTENADLVNRKAVKRLAKISKEKDIKLIHISTDYVFDGKNYKPYTEANQTNPNSVYGKTKLTGELEMMKINPYSSIIIRTSWVYSSFGNNFVKTMLKLGKTKDELGVIFDQIGTPTYARDLAQVILDILPNIHNPQIQIKNKSDINPSFGVEELASTLSGIIIEQPDESGMMIGIFGRWGRGKTYLANQTWKQVKAKKEHYEIVEFSAWKYQDTKSSWAYLYEIFLEKYLDSNSKWYKLKLWKFFLINKKKYGISSIFFFIINLAITGTWIFWIDQIPFFFNVLSLFGIVILFKIFFFYMQHKKSAIGLFKKYFSKTSFKDVLGFQSEIQDEIKALLQTWIPTVNKDKKIVLFVDDLDRCSTEQMINVLDGLRLILDDEQIHSRLIIVTSIDEEILQKAFYSQKYLLDDKTNTNRNYFKEYLEKVFLIGIKLDILDDNESKEYFENLLTKEKIKPKESNNTQSSTQAQEDKKDSPEDETQREEKKTELFELTQDEKELIEDSLKNLTNPTPRKIRIFYYKYLIAKRLYNNKEEIEELINSLIEVTNSQNITSSNPTIQKIAKMVGTL